MEGTGLVVQRMVILRKDMTSRLGGVPLGYLLQQGTGALTKVVQDDVRNLHAFVADSTPLVGRSLAMPAATLKAFLVLWAV